MARITQIALDAQKKIDVQAATKTISENVKMIKDLIDVSRDLASQVGIPFSLESIDLYTEQEARDNWENSGC